MITEQYKNILVIVAMECEEDAMIKGRKYKEFTLSERLNLTLKHMPLLKGNVYIGKSGIGLVNTATLLALMLEKYEIDAVIQLGVGGAVSPDLNVGDVVIADRIIQHDSVASSEQGIALMAPGEPYHSLKDEDKKGHELKTCSTLSAFLFNAFGEQSGTTINSGGIVSGSEFCGDTERKKWLRSLADNVLLVEMESASTAQICTKSNVPFAVAKTVADSLCPATEISEEYLSYLDFASSRSSDVLNAVMSD